MRVLLTGCAGYIGRALARRLRERGVVVVGVDRDPWGPEVAGLGERMDLAEAGSSGRLAALMADVDAVFHLAAARVDWGLDYAGYARDNLEVTREVVEAAALAGVDRWVYLGTVGVYGSGAHALDETAPFAPATDYATTKALAEQLLLERAASAGWVVRILRPSAVFSEEQPANTNLYRLIEAIRRNRFVLVGDGSEIKTTSYLHNVVDATLWLYDDLGKGGVEAYNYVDEPKLTTREMVDVIREELGSRLPLVRCPLGVAEKPALALDWLAERLHRDLPVTAARIRKFCTPTNFDASRIREAGFVPRYGSHDALRRTVHWHRSLARNA